MPSATSALAIARLRRVLSQSARATQWRVCLDLWEHHRLSICASSAISACGRRSDWRRSLEIYEAFDREAPPPVRDPAPLNALLAALATGAQWSLGLTLLRAVQRAALDVWGWNSAIHACGRAAQWRSAWALLDELQRRRLADASSVNAAISACDRAAVWEGALALLGQVHPKPDVVGFSAAIAACAKRAVWRQALHLWRSHAANEVGFGATITACGRSTRWTLALQLFTDALSASLASLTSFGAADRCLALLASAMREPALADRVTCAAVAEACASAVAWATALHLASLGQPPVAQIAAREALELAQVSVQLPRTQVFGRLAWRRWQDTLRTPSSSHPEEITLASAQGRLLLETRQIGVDAASSGASRSARCSTAPFAGDILLPEPSRDQLTASAWDPAMALQIEGRVGLMADSVLTNEAALEACARAEVRWRASAEQGLAPACGSGPCLQTDGGPRGHLGWKKDGSYRACLIDETNPIRY
ncbi:unnamed protein product [Durusdinium trenchii]|uniref:Pentatricopeptide repeat-containing protein, chloroplastic n=1 Tax=Durusdinium trenchii TaxID=1381693 RepID=A0ABP0SZG6_9DINO